MFENKIAIVTGGGAGIGEAVCRELAHRGALVTVADINGDDAERVTTTIASDGGRAQARRVDVADEQDTKHLIKHEAARKPVTMIEASQAAVTILDGVARNHALIVFPGYVPWAWRGYRLFPRAMEQVFCSADSAAPQVPHCGRVDFRSGVKVA